MGFNQIIESRHGIDISVIALQNSLNANLWNNLGYTAYGVAEVINEGEHRIPVIYNSGINYTKIFPFPITPISEGLAVEINAISFFIPSNNRKVGDIRTEAEISLYFVAKLNEIYSTVSTYRANENAINDIVKLIDLTDFDIDNYYLHAEAVSDFRLPDLERRKMHPYLFLKFLLTINY